MADNSVTVNVPENVNVGGVVIQRNNYPTYPAPPVKPL